MFRAVIGYVIKKLIDTRRPTSTQPRRLIPGNVALQGALRSSIESVVVVLAVALVYDDDGLGAQTARAVWRRSCRQSGRRRLSGTDRLRR